MGSRPPPVRSPSGKWQSSDTASLLWARGPAAPLLGVGLRPSTLCSPSAGRAKQHPPLGGVVNCATKTPRPFWPGGSSPTDCEPSVHASVPLPAQRLLLGGPPTQFRPSRGQGKFHQERGPQPGERGPTPSLPRPATLTSVGVEPGRTEGRAGARLLPVVEPVAARQALGRAPARAGLTAPVAPVTASRSCVPKVAQGAHAHALPGETGVGGAFPTGLGPVPPESGQWCRLPCSCLSS